MGDPLELRRDLGLLRLKVERLETVIEACNAYHGAVLQALCEALELARKHGAPEAELLAIRRRVL